MPDSARSLSERNASVPVAATAPRLTILLPMRVSVTLAPKPEALWNVVALIVPPLWVTLPVADKSNTPVVTLAPI